MNSSFDVRVMLIFGCIAYFMQKVELPPVQLFSGIVLLAPSQRANPKKFPGLSDGSWTIFFKRAYLSWAFIILTCSIWLLKKNDKKQRSM